MPQFIRDALLDHFTGLLIEEVIGFITAIGLGKWIYNKVDEWLFITLIENPNKKRKRR